MAKTTKKTREELDPTADVFGRNLSSVMTKLDWSQSELGRQLGVSQAQASKYAAGKSTPPFSMLTKLQEKSGVPVAEFFRTDETPSPRIERHALADEVRNAVIESSQENTKLMIEVLERLKPVISSLQRDGAKEVEVRNAPRDKFTAFMNTILREPGVSGDFYQLIDEDADLDTLRVEFAREIFLGLLSMGGALATRTRKVLAEVLAEKEKKQ